MLTRPEYSRSESPDVVVLVDPSGNPVGKANRTTVHTDATPLHLAFSAYLFNARGEVLLTRRALSKHTWPGVWTNSCCGHPRPGEDPEEAVHRRVREELGLTIAGLTPLLPRFRYRATDSSGVVENEICPVYAGFVDGDDPAPNPAEVAEWAWVPWSNFAAAITANPRAYSPWSATQVPRIMAEHPGVPHLFRTDPSPADPEAAVADVDELLTKELTALAREWDHYTDGLTADVLPNDLPRWLRGLLVGRGKRLRVRLAYWGFLAGGGRHGTPGYHHLIRVAAALETLHLFALVHDDVMDESDSRRGRPSAHCEAVAWHGQAGGAGDGRVFGRNLAILLGDLAHTLADRMVDELPDALRASWYSLSIELMAGQRADLTGAAAGRRDRRHAEHVARLKSGRYTVTRPLELGAAAAGASPEATAALLACGEHLGYAFALRDDYLGVWGDPAVTGKPAGDDLFEAKPTVLLSLAAKRLSGEAAALLDRVGTDLPREDVRALAAAIRSAGVDTELDRLIAEQFEASMACLTSPGGALEPDAVEGLRATARAAVWRDA